MCRLLPSVHRILLPLLLEMRDVPCSCLTQSVRQEHGTSVKEADQWDQLSVLTCKSNSLQITEIDMR